MNTTTHKIMILGVFVLAGIALVGTIVLAWNGKKIDAEIAGLAGVAIGGVLGHLAPQGDEENK